jgi:secreted PhoX family phosphatase
VQHPGEDGELRIARDPRTNPQSSWPDGPGTAARPATIAIRHTDGRKIGS